MRISSKKTSVVEWFIIVRIGLIVMPLPTTLRISTKKMESPSVLLATSSRGVVRASNIIRSEYSARLVQIFWPFMTYSSPSRTATVRNESVSVPLVGSETPKACKRNSPVAIRGRYSCFCSSLPYFSSVFMMYICACADAPLHPAAWISSIITAASSSFSPDPP